MVRQWSRIRKNSRDKDNPKIGQQRTILRHWSESAHPAIGMNPGVLTVEIER